MTDINGIWFFANWLSLPNGSVINLGMTWKMRILAIFQNGCNIVFGNKLNDFLKNGPKFAFSFKKPKQLLVMQCQPPPPNFMMLLKWWSSIRIFSQICWYSNFENRKMFSTLSNCGEFWQIYFLKRSLPQFSFCKMVESHHKTKSLCGIIFL